MNHKTLLASTLTLLMAGSASLVMAQTAPPPPPPSTVTMQGHPPGPGKHAGHGMRGGDRRGGGHRQGGAVLGDLRELEKLYMVSGRSKELAAVYNDVLARSQDPRVRDYTYHQLARLQARPTDVDQAIATLRKSLNESLANEAKMRAAHEKMRAQWQQRRGAAMSKPMPPAGK